MIGLETKEQKLADEIRAASIAVDRAKDNLIAYFREEYADPNHEAHNCLVYIEWLIKKTRIDAIFNMLMENVFILDKSITIEKETAMQFEKNIRELWGVEDERVDN